MLFTKARAVPDCAPASGVSLFKTTVNTPSSCFKPTEGCKLCVKVPNGPLTVMFAPLMLISAPLGTGIGDLPTRDIFLSLRDVANNFATNAVCTCFAVCHYALWG